MLAFLTDPAVQTALIIGNGAAIVSAIIGVFTIIRGQSFAGHALADVSSTGGAAAFLLGISPLFGFLGMAVLSAFALESFSQNQAKERALTTGILLGAGLGLTALLLYLDVTTKNTSGATISVMFGSMFAIPPTLITPVLTIGALALIVTAAIYRPLLLTSLSPELARVQKIPVRLIGLTHLLVLSLAVTLSAMTIGAVLSTALLIGPAATALRLARSPALALLLAAAIGLLCTTAGILLSYESYTWTQGHTWPVSFFIVTLIFATYLIVMPGQAGIHAFFSTKSR
jgi:zinc/manganese transport system permease protein